MNDTTAAQAGGRVFEWRYPCGHTRTLKPYEWFPVYEPCLRCHLEAKAAKR